MKTAETNLLTNIILGTASLEDFQAVNDSFLDLGSFFLDTYADSIFDQFNLIAVFPDAISIEIQVHSTGEKKYTIVVGDEGDYVLE